MTRYLIADPGGAAHPAKNAPAAPGFPNHPDDCSERTPMIVSAPVPGFSLVVGALATACDAYDAALTDDDATTCTSMAMQAALQAALPQLLNNRVVYDPHRMDRLVAQLAAREVAARLRERAAWHRQQADHDTAGGFPHSEPLAGWHRGEAEALEQIAERELVNAGIRS